MTILIRILDWLTVSYFYFYLGLFVTDYSFIFSPLHRNGFPFSNISNIAAPTIGLFFLLILRYSVNKKSFSESPLIKKLKGIAGLSDKRLLFISGVIIFVILTVLSIARHISLSSGASDLGIFDQAIWNTAHGDILFSSLKNNMNLLGDHFEPVLLLIAPLYLLWPNVIILFLVQSILLASAVIPLYLIARAELKERFLILAFIVSYILSRPLRGVGLSDFHPECFVLTLLFWAYYFVKKRKNTLLVLTVLLLLFCKEDVAFLISGLGIFVLFSQKRFRLGFVLFIAGIAAWFLETKIIIPHFNPSGVYPYMDRLPFGLTYMDNIKAVINNPFLLVNSFLTKEKMEYCVKLLAPLGFLSILSPAHYVLIAIPLFKNILPVNINFSGFYNITSHYTAGIIPFVYISAISGAGWLLSKIRYKKAPFFMGLFIILSSLLFYGKTDGYKLARFLQGIKKNRSLEILSYLKRVPKNASVATNFSLVPHLSHRKYIFEWNPRSEAAYITEYVVVDMNLSESLAKEDIAEIKPYFEDIASKGYKNTFSSKDLSFLIFHNPNIDKTLVEKR